MRLPPQSPFYEKIYLENKLEEGVLKMVILNFKSMKTLEILRCFKRLSEIDKLRLAIHLLESNYLHADINKEKEIQQLEERLIELDSNYATTITNFSKYIYLTVLFSMFMELSEYNKKIFATEMLEIINE